MQQEAKISPCLPFTNSFIIINHFVVLAENGKVKAENYVSLTRDFVEPSVLWFVALTILAYRNPRGQHLQRCCT